MQPGGAEVTLDILERQILVENVGDPLSYYHRILAVYVSGSRWAVISPTLELHVEDFGGVNIVRLLRHSEFHKGDGECALPAPDFNLHAAGLMQGGAQVLKQHRLARRVQGDLAKLQGGP